MKRRRCRRIVLYALSAIVLLLIVFPRRPIVEFLSMADATCDIPQLIVVMGGGFRPDGELGRSTRERLDALLELDQDVLESSHILISEYPGGRSRMERYLLENGIPGDRLMSGTFQFREGLSGTVQNVQDMMSAVVALDEVEHILIITSPYHQRRVNLVLHQQLSIRTLPRPVSFRFLPFPPGSEIYTCNRLRFLRLVAREIGGIVIQRMSGS